MQMLFEGRYKKSDMIIFDIFFIYFLFHHLSFRKTEGGLILVLTLKGLFKLFVIFIQRMVSLMVILFSKKCFLFVHLYIDLIKLKVFKLFENSDASPGFSKFLMKPTCIPNLINRYPLYVTRHNSADSVQVHQTSSVLRTMYFQSHDHYCLNNQLHMQLMYPI